MNEVRFCRAKVLIVALLLAITARAQAGDTEAARELFQRGVQGAQQGQVEEALGEFEAAYALSPHFSVLYNIARAQTDLARPVEAIASFTKYLEEGGEQIPPPRRQQVLDLIATNQKRVGQLVISAQAPNATRVWLDGAELSASQVGSKLSVKAGEHALLHVVRGNSPVSESVRVTPGNTVEVKIDAGPALPLAAPGIVAVICRVPGMLVDIAGLPPLQTPIAKPLIVPSGSVRVRFARPLYLSAEQTVNVAPDTVTTVDCKARLATPLSATQSSQLMVDSAHPDATLTVDGERYVGSRLPPGPHHVSLARDGFVTIETVLNLEAGKTLIYSPRFEPTRATRARWARESAHRRTSAFILGGAAASMLLASGALYLWQAQPEPAADLNTALSIRRVDDVSIGLLIGGVGAALGAAGVVFSGSSDQER